MTDEQAEPGEDGEPLEAGAPAEGAQAAPAPRPLPAAPEPPHAEPPKRLLRSRTNRVVTGVSGGIGAYLGIDPVLVRIGFVLATIFGGGLGLLIYVVAAVVMPLDPLLPPPAAVGASAGPPPQRDAGSTAALVVGLLLVVAGSFWLLDVLDVRTPPWEVVLALALILVGGALLWEARRTRHGGLIALGAVIALVLAGTTAARPSFDVDSAFGERSERPRTVAELEREYDHAFGSLTVDLRSLDLPVGTTRIDVSVAFGEAVVWLPTDVPARVESSATFGSSDVFGVDRGGIDLDRRHQDAGYAEAPSRLLVDVRVVFGSAEVRR